MSRPGLIVGLGGTGQWVLTWLKRDLMLSHNNEWPSNIRLLAVDTTSQLEAGARSVAMRQNEEEVKLGDVKLSKEEFVHIGGDALKLTQEVNAGRHENIGKWYQARRWLDTMGPSGFSLDDGAGRIRQFGRVAIFYNLLQREGSLLWRALHNAIEGVRRQVSEERKLEIIVVGSFAGGTGSGMFLDVALILRMLAQQLNVSHTLRGYFALPSVFTGSPEAEMLARTFAAWRELNRFMVVNSDFPMPLVEYVSGHQKFRIMPKQRIFDACYLVDSRRAGTPIAAEAKYGAHPMVAEAISAILDEHAGTVYTQHIFQNLNPEYVKTPDTPLYSAVGAYTIQVPAHYKEEVSSLEFSKEMLKKILSPRDKKLAATGAQRHVSLAAPDQNQEAEVGTPGRAHSRQLLTQQTVTYRGESAQPTLFTGRIAQIVDTAIDKGNEASVIDALARAGIGGQQGGAAAGWTAYFPKLGDDPQFEQLRRNVEQEINYNLVQAFQRKDKESKEDARNRFTKIASEVRTRYGGLTSTGGEVRGTFGERLHDAQEYHILLFRRLVRLRLLSILNGQSENPIVAKSGKLGYALDYFDGLVEEFDSFLRLMVKVKQRREELKPTIQAQGVAQQTQNLMNRRANDKIFWIIEAPRVKQDENNYLLAQQRLADIRKEDLLHHYVVETAREMKALCSEVRDSLQAWVYHLTTGDDPKGIAGLWNILERDMRGVNSDYGFDKATPAIQAMMADEIPEVDDEVVAQALRSWEWDAAFADGGSQLKLQARILPEAAGGQPVTLDDPTQPTTGDRRWSLAQQNRHHLTSLARRRFAGTAARTTVAEEIKEQYGENVERFADQVALGSEPLFHGGVGAAPRRKSNLIRVQAPENDPFFYGANGLEGVLRKREQLDTTQMNDYYNIRVVNSENPFKLTLVRTDDLYRPEEFSAWEECRAAYSAHMAERFSNPMLDPQLLQNFSAEVQAVRFERMFVQQDHETYTALHPRVVMLLENPRALQQFLYLGMLNMVREVKGDNYRWELRWTKGNREQVFWLTQSWNALTDSQRPRPDVLNAIHGYVIMGQTWQPGSEAQIDYDFAARLIEQRQKELGPDRERRMLEHHIHDGFIASFAAQAIDPDGTGRVLHVDYRDLAKVARKMLEERLAELDENEAIAKRDLFTGYDPSDAGSESPEEVAAPSGPFVTPTAIAPSPAAGATGTSGSRLSPLLAQPGRVEEFIYLGMLGMIQPRQDRRGHRWELVWTRGATTEAIWLTESWDARANSGQPQPDIIDALHGYTVVGHSQQPGRSDAIDYGFARHLIEDAKRRLGPQGETEMLENNLADTGFVGWLRSQAYDPHVRDRLVNPEYDELARALERLLEERLDDLTGRNKPSAASPFKVFSPFAGAQASPPVSAPSSGSGGASASPAANPSGGPSSSGPEAEDAADDEEDGSSPFSTPSW